MSNGTNAKHHPMSVASQGPVVASRGQEIEQPTIRGVLFFLVLESTGVDTASEQIVELACCHAPSDPMAREAAFSTTVRASAEDTAFHVHGIDAHEIASGPDFSVVGRDFLVLWSTSR